MLARGPSRELSDQPVWRQRLRDPAIGNLCAVLAVLVAVAAGIGLLRQGLFWLIFSYFTLIAALGFVLAFGRHNAQKLRILGDERGAQQLALEDLKNTLGSTEAELAFAREELEAAEGGYASLREAVIQTAYRPAPDIQDFDDELGHALRQLIHRQAPAHPAAR